MTAYIFLNGRPGCGKSECARAIAAQYGQTGNVVVLNDYHQLLQMCMEEQSWPEERRRFLLRQREGVSGFDILDRSVLPCALSQLAAQARRYQRERKLVVIEFARSDYTGVFDIFGPTLLEDAHFFFLQAPLGVCIDRISQRVSRNIYRDDRPIEEAVMRKHYQDDGYQSWLSACGGRRGARVLDNGGAWDETWLSARAYLDKAISQTVHAALWPLGSGGVWNRPAYQDLPWQTRI